MVILEFYCCPCGSCEKMLVEFKKFSEVQEINRDAESDKVIISITGDPSRVKIVLKNKRKQVLEHFEQNPTVNNHKMQIVLPQNPVSGICDQHMIPPQPVDKPTVKKSQVCCPKCNRELKLKKSNKRFTCDGCMQDGFGSRNRCEDCNYDLHQECTSPEPTTSPEFFRIVIFEFCRQPKQSTRSCYACGKSIHGYFYHCKSNQLNLHPCCAKLKIKLCGMDFVHQDEVVSSSSSSACMWCKKQASSSSTKSRGPGGCSYVCTRTKFHFHVYCITEMVHEAWKKGVIIDDSTNDISTALKEMDLQLMMPNSDKSTVNGIIETLKTVSPFVAAIVSIISGDTLGIVVPLLEILVQLNS
ncbi:hypothetical protein ACSBR1_007633 [Camellia fascicularis]